MVVCTGQSETGTRPNSVNYGSLIKRAGLFMRNTPSCFWCWGAVLLKALTAALLWDFLTSGDTAREDPALNSVNYMFGRESTHLLWPTQCQVKTRTLGKHMEFVTIWLSLAWTAGFPGGTNGKEPTCQCRRRETRVQSLGQEDPWRRAWQSAPVVLPGESHGQRSLAGYSPQGHK